MGGQGVDNGYSPGEVTQLFGPRLVFTARSPARIATPATTTLNNRGCKFSSDFNRATERTG